MKLKLLCVCGAALIGLPSCVMEPVEIGPSGPGYHPGYRPGYNPGYGQSYNPGYGQSYNPGYGAPPGTGAYDKHDAERWYRAGYSLGATDFQNGQRPSVSRHLGPVPWQYRQGFTDAYNNAYRTQAQQARPTPNYQSPPPLIPHGLRRF